MTAEQEEMVFRNQPLVGKVAKQYYGDYRELFDKGMIGLIKGVIAFDKTKGFKETTYLYQCIQNEIRMLFRKPKINTISLEKEINKSDGNISLIDLIEDKKENVEERIMKKEQIRLLYKAIDKLKEREKKVICHLYGVYGYKKITQKQLSNILKLSQPQISRTKNNAINKLKKEMMD